MKTTLERLFYFITVLLTFVVNAQTNIKYGANYIVFEAEDTTLNNKWAIRTPDNHGDQYLEYLFYKGNSPEPTNNTYLEYIGPWQGAGSELEYKFTCPKTGKYQMAMRLHTPLRETTHTKHVLRVDPRDGVEKKWEPGDLRNDCFIKLEGNFTKGHTSVNPTQEDLETFHKFFGRGANRWGSNINIELHGRGNHGAIYNLIEGEEYVFHLKGRSTTAIIDYIAFYETSYLAHDIHNQSTDLALQLPVEIRPYNPLIALSIVPNTAVVRKGKTTTLQIVVTPSNSNPSVLWSSSDSSIISIDANSGVVTGLGVVGQKAVITATSTVDNSIVTTKEVAVISDFSIEVNSVSIVEAQADVLEGGTIAFTTEVGPNDADNKTLLWSSVDENIARVDQNGVVTGVSAGSTTIKAASVDNSTVFDTATVEVVSFVAPSIKFDDRQKYIDTSYSNQGNMEVFVEFNAGSLNTITSMTLFLRHMNESWKVEEDLKIDVTDTNVIGANSGVYKHVVSLTGLTPAADLLEGHFYFLFVKMTTSDGASKNQGANPIKITNKSLSINSFVLNKVVDVSPNPATDYVRIKVPQQGVSATLSIVNMYGVRVLYQVVQKESEFLDISNLSQGVYFLQLKDGNKILAAKKIMVK